MQKPPDIKTVTPQNPGIKIPKMFLTILNHLYEIEHKSNRLEEFNKISRNIERIKDAFREELVGAENGTGLLYEDPMGQAYDETRNDLDANISGESTESLVVVEVIKPIIWIKNPQQGLSKVVQNGVVIVESKTEQNEAE